MNGQTDGRSDIVNVTSWAAYSRQNTNTPAKLLKYVFQMCTFRNHGKTTNFDRKFTIFWMR